MAAKKRKGTNRPAGKAAPPKRAAAPAAGPRKIPRSERIEAERQARRRRATLIRGLAIGAVVLAVLTVVVLQVRSRRGAQQAIDAMTAASCDYDTRTDPGAVNEHASSVSFKIDPPSGGVHLPTAARAGRFTLENQPPEGQVVHALEHGYVAIHHRPDVTDEQLRPIVEVYEAFSDDVLVLPRASLTVPIAATAWHRRLLCAEIEPAAVRRFVTEYRGQGPEKVPRG